MRFVLTLLLFLPWAANAADGNWLMGTNVPQPNVAWQFYNAGDAPEGGWRAVSDSNTNVPIGTIVCPFTIAAGTNYFMAKVIDYSGINAFWFIVGANSNYVTLTNSDWNRYWTTPIAVNVAAATNTFQILPIVVQGGQEETRTILRGIYVTTNFWENIYAEEGAGLDYILNYQYPTNIDATAAVKGNLIENGGFEVGITHGWGINAESDLRDTALHAMWDTNVAHTGQASLHIPVDERMSSGSFTQAFYQVVLESKVYRNFTNRQYSLSVWTKGTSTENGSLTIRNPIVVPPALTTNLSGLNYSNSFSVTTNLAAGTNWHRTVITTNFAMYPTDHLQIEIRVPTNTWIDSIQFEEGAVTDYAPKGNLELGIITGRTGNLFLTNETVTLPVYGFATNAGTYTVNWEAYDWLNRMVGSGSVPLTLSANARGSANITPNINKTGVFRLVVWASGQVGTTEESIFVVLPTIAASSTNLFAGIDAPPETYVAQPMFDSGMRMVRAMSTFKPFHWAHAEPVDDYFRYSDVDIAKFISANVQIMGCLYANGLGEVPAYAQDAGNGNLPKTNEWAEFVRTMVTYHKTNIHHWEIMNEPLYWMSTNFYATLLIIAGSEIRLADPTATIIGMGGVHDDDWVKSVLQIIGSGWTNYMDVISTHLYPTDVDPSGGDTANKSWQWHTNIIIPYNVPVWNTEAGIKELGMAEFNASYVAPGTALWPHLDSERFHNGAHFYGELSLKNALTCFGWGQSKYFYYEARTVASPSALGTTFTSMDYDDSLKTKHVLLSVLNALIGTATGQGQVTNGTATIFLFADNTNSWLTIWSSTNLPASITFATNNLTAYDAMGNALALSAGGSTNQTLTYGRKPVYVCGLGMATNVLRTLASTAVITNLADTTPPNVSIDVAPKGVAAGSVVYFRWIGMDEVSIPSESAPSVIEYQTKLDGGSWSDWSAYHTRTFSGVDESQHTFYVAARDLAGNISTNSVEFNLASGVTNIATQISGKATINGRVNIQ